MNYVFYKGVLLSQYDPALIAKQGIPTPRLPKFSWIYNSQQGFWYRMETPNLATYIKAEDVPADVRLLMVLLS